MGIDSMLKNHDKRNQYLNRKSYLDRRLQRDVIENGIAYIPCRVESINDVISKYSVKGCESLDTEFLMFIVDFAGFIPPDYPVVLQITGPEFSVEEKRIISETIAAETDYMLGRTEEFLSIKKRRFMIMLAGTIISGILLGIAKRIIEDVPLEFFFVLFWLFADSLVRYLFVDKLDFKDEKIHMGRLASMEVEFKKQDAGPESYS